MNSVSMLRSCCVALSLLLAACGGGGGSTPSAVTYSGATSQATVTAVNAKALSVDAFEGGQAGAALNIVGVAAASGAGTQASVPRPQALTLTLENAATRSFAAGGSVVQTVVGVTQQATVPGPGGGSASYTININEPTGEFSSTISFSAYKGEPTGAAVSGVVNFSGVFNRASQTFSSITMSFPSMTVTEGGASYNAGGTVTSNLTGSTKTTVVALVLQNGATGQTYWVKDFTYTLGAAGTLTVAGTYYDHVHGYVTISTLTPLQVTALDARPTAGVLLASGANGSTARLTFIATGHIVDVDLNGSGVFAIVP